MTARNDDDPLFSAGKPKNLPWLYLPAVIGLIVAMVFLYALSS